MHPAGGSLDESGKWAPNKAKWAKPEGILDVNSDVLKLSIFECDIYDKKKFQIDVVNKCMLHGCSGYCLKPDGHKQNDSNESSTLQCRFHLCV